MCGESRNMREPNVSEGTATMGYMRIDTPIGPLVVSTTEVGVVRVTFGGADRADGGPAPMLAEVRRQLEQYFAGSREVFELPIDWSRTSGYQQRVLQELYASVGFGQTMTYGELAARTGDPEAARAVGVAMATNPIPVVVPCHRVVASGGELGGFGGGLEMKRWLLTHEGAMPPTLFPIDVAASGPGG
jgi:methylated-DNA-[protein]-cysteine S-methyltransferase